MNEAQALALTYFDKFTVKRNTKVKDEETGITSNQLITIVENIQGALSKKDNQVLNTSDIGSLTYIHELITFPNIDIKKGDTIIVTSASGIDTFTASKPFIYPNSHLEVYLAFKERV